jgi:hypothetical protein
MPDTTSWEERDATFIMATRKKSEPSDAVPNAADRPDMAPAQAPPLSLPKIIAGTLLLAILTVAGTYVFGGFAGMSARGVMALILGVTLSYALGVGLMAALFHSSRFHDESAYKATLDQFKDRHTDA